ncbi:glycosyltransferase [aff. Roholtiella sp. LEGE 12411]|nr:glycosyltransferase [aff. Roholtiella sp. LEGE 12411]
MPLCVMEAMAKGLPVIASAVSGIPEELGETGKLLTDPKIDPQATVQELVTTIEDWAINPQLRQSIGQACKQRAEELFREERMIKETVEVIEHALLPDGDYVSPGFKVIRPDQAFTNMIVGDTKTCGWIYLRREIPHNWYVDKRQATVGFLSRDEAHILYNTALMFKGKKALEIGCWLGWSACHIGLAGMELDVIDPLLAREDIFESVNNSLQAAGVLDSINLVSGYSPQKVEELAEKLQRKWSLIFIDGDHEAPGPLNDAILCEQLAEADALIIFHDLNSPDVAEGLDYFKQKGWNTMVYQTMQIMGVAWRGNVEPVKHQPDPKITWNLPKHLQHYVVPNGMIQVDDYGHWEGCKKAVNEFERLKENQFILHQIDYTGVWFQKLQYYPKLPLAIIIDGVFFQLYQTGIARVWKSLLEEWANNGFGKHIVILDRAETAPKIPGIRYRSVPHYDYNNTDNDREMLQQLCDEEGADLFISSYYTTPTTTPSVFMAYDMIPEVMGWNMNNPMWREKHKAIQHASGYIAISEHTAHDLVSCFTDIPVNSVTVAHCGVKSTFSPAKTEEVNALKSKYGITKPYFILVGGGSGYKNSTLFFQAFSQLTSSYGFDIVFTGSGGLLAPEFRAYTSGSVVYMLQLSDEELITAYSGAVALVYPSKYEGFGMPIIEAMACGCPVITCPNASIPEVAGEAVIYVNHDDVDELVNALCEVQKPGVRTSLITAGLAQAKKFSWAQMAQSVSSALIDATLVALNLKEINLIVFPDWSQPEELIGLELERVIRIISIHPNSEKTTLLINTGSISAEDAEMFLSSVAMNLLVQEDLDITEGLEVSLVAKLADIQWEALLPRIHARIILEYEDTNALSQAKAETLISYEIEVFSEAQAEQFFFA